MAATSFFDGNFSLDRFMNQYKDFARGYLFYAKIDGGPVPYDTNYTYLVRSSTLPAVSITPIESNWQGNVYKLGSTQEFAEHTISFTVDPESKVRGYFLDWAKSVHNPETNEHGDPSQYMALIQLDHLNTAGQAIARYQLIHAWPSTVGEVTLDYTSKEFAMFDVTFTYQRHVHENL